MADKNEPRSGDVDDDEDGPSSDESPSETSKKTSAPIAKSTAAAKSAVKPVPAKSAASTKAAAKADEDDEEEEEEDDDDSEDDEDADEEDSESDDERDESTRGVAKALGIDEDEDDDAAKDEEARAAEANPNRAARRREEAQKRRAARELVKKSGLGIVAGNNDDDAIIARATDPERKLPRDKNARAKELLKRRQEASTTRVQLGASELVQDSLARAGSATAKTLRKNLGLIVTVLGIASAGAIGYLLWTGHKDSAVASASDELMVGVEADRAPTQKEDKRTDEEKKNDPNPFYTSDDVRTDTALAAYKKVIDEHGGTGPAIIAKLGEAGVLLDRAKYDQAIDAYGQVVSSQLAGAELDVKARATEGIGFAREGKGDLDGAMATFKELEAIKGYDDLGKYHQGRILLKQGKKDEAKTLLLDLRKKIEVPPLDGAPQKFLTEATNEILGALDPSLARRQTALGGMRGDSMNSDEEDDAKKRAIEALKRQIQQQQKEHPGSPIQIPNMPGQDPE